MTTQVYSSTQADLQTPGFAENWGDILLRTASYSASDNLGRHPVALGTGGALGITLTLPAVATAPYKTYFVKKVDAGVGAVTVDGNGAETIDGAASVALSAQYDSIGVVTDGTEWHVIEPAGWGGFVPPAGTCWLYCVANRTTYGGTGAGASLTTPGGDDDTLLGYYAGNALTTGDLNSSFGSYSMRYLSTGARNSCFGAYAGEGAVGDNYDDNSFFGAYAGQRIEGTQTTGVGSGALQYQDIGGSNTALGYNAGKGVDGVSAFAGSTFLGCQSGEPATTANYNTAGGFQSLGGITSGYSHAVFGYQAGASLTTAYGCVMLGYRAGQNETNSQRLYIHNDNDATPLIYGEFDNGFATIHGDLGIGTTVEPTANGGAVVFCADNGADPTMGANTCGFYGKDVGGTVEAFAIDEGGAAAQLTPHDASTGKWVARVRSADGVWMQVEMEDMMRALDRMLGGGHIREWTN